MISYCLLASHFITLGPKLIKRPCSMHHCSIFRHFPPREFISSRFISFHFTSFYLLAFQLRQQEEETSNNNAKNYAQLWKEARKKEEREKRGRGEEGIWASLAITKAKWIKIMQMSHKINYESYTRRRQRWEKLSKLWKLCKREQKKNVFCCYSCCCCIVLLNDDQRAAQRLPRRNPEEARQRRVW